MRLNFHKWFSCVVSKHQGDFGFDAADLSGNCVLNKPMKLTKSQLTQCILGYTRIVLEFSLPKNDFLFDLASNLGKGRPFFTNLLHKQELLSSELLGKFCKIMNVQEQSLLHLRIVNRELLYDLDHTKRSVYGLLHLQRSLPCQKLDEVEFANLLSVAFYLHSLKDLEARIVAVVSELMTNSPKRLLMKMIFQWIVEFHISVDLLHENDPKNKHSSDRLKWKHCEMFDCVTLEDLSWCCDQAAVAVHLLRDRPKTLDTLYKLFQRTMSNTVHQRSGKNNSWEARLLRFSSSMWTVRNYSWPTINSMT